VDAATERALRESDELELVTAGRVSGRPHTVRLRFAYADGLVWLRTDERPPAPDAQGVRRRTARERDPDWLRNLAVEPRCRIRVGAATLEARYEPSPEPRADLERVVGLLREKYGADWVADWYVDRGRVPVRLRPAK